MDSETFGGWLARQLVAHGFRSQCAFAKAIDMDPTYLSRIINGHVARPERETLERIAQRLALPYADVAREAGALPDLPADAMPPAPPPPPADADPSFDPEMIVRYVESYPGAEFRAELAALKRDYPGEPYRRMVLGIYRLWTAGGRTVAEAAREAR